MAPIRFIQLARHGGCSKKIDGVTLNNLLNSMAVPWDVTGNESKWEDAGIYLTDEMAFVANVDIVLPMVNNPADFGEIVVAHVLSDLYAVGAKPLFGLNILHVSEFPEISNLIVHMLDSATKKLHSAGAVLKGGHTLIDDELKYGLAIFGMAPTPNLVPISGAKPGDRLLLTKPLGTSVASKRWRESSEFDNKFDDVLAGMKLLNDIESSEMVRVKAHACTDITGYGLLGHTHNLLRESQMSGVIRLHQIPVYPSVKVHGDDSCYTRIMKKNIEYVKRFVKKRAKLSNWYELSILYDAQVSGGLLIALPVEKVDPFVQSLQLAGRMAYVVGEVLDGNPGEITIEV